MYVSRHMLRTSFYVKQEQWSVEDLVEERAPGAPETLPEEWPQLPIIEHFGQNRLNKIICVY